MLKCCYLLIESDFYLSSIESSEMRAAVLGRSSGCLGLFLDPLGLPLFLAGAAAGASCGGGATRMGVVFIKMNPQFLIIFSISDSIVVSE